MQIEHLILFILSTIGMCNIIVDSSLLEPVRAVFKNIMNKIKLPKLASLVDCYMCCGAWCGFLMGYTWISEEFLKIFACGCVGSFVSHYATVHVNWVEAATIVNLPDET